MKKQTMFLLVLGFSLACQFLAPARNGTVIANCMDVVNAVRGMQSGAVPHHLLATGIKRGDEFDANGYFTVLSSQSYFNARRLCVGLCLYQLT